MSIITKVNVSSNFLPLTEAIESNPGLEVEFKPVIPLGDKIIPYMWVSNEHIDHIKEYLDKEKTKGLENYEIVDFLDDRALVKVEWDKNSAKVLKLITDFNGLILDMKGKRDNWNITLQFLDQNYLSDFYKTCKKNNIDLKIQKSEKLKDLDGFISPKLSEKQLEALKLAYKKGYFDVPRKMSAKDLSKELDISDSAFSQRLRRGIKNLIENQLLEE